MNLTDLANQIVNGKRLCRKDDLSFFKDCDLTELCTAADFIREKLCGKHVDLCSIINGKSGRCSENCKFCAQSSFNHTDCETYSFLDQKEILKTARQNQSEGVHRFAAWGVLRLSRRQHGAFDRRGALWRRQACAVYPRRVSCVYRHRADDLFSRDPGLLLLKSDYKKTAAAEFSGSSSFVNIK